MLGGNWMSRFATASLPEMRRGSSGSVVSIAADLTSSATAGPRGMNFWRDRPAKSYETPVRRLIQGLVGDVDRTAAALGFFVELGADSFHAKAGRGQPFRKGVIQRGGPNGGATPRFEGGH